MRKVFWLFFILLVGCYSPKTGEEGDLMPAVNILLVDSVSIFNPRYLPGKEPTVLVFFDPYCQYCRAETESILKDIDKFSNKQICFLSIAPMKDVRRFYEDFNMSKYSNVHVGVDIGAVYMKTFGVTTVPHTSIYSGDKLLMKVYTSNIESRQLLLDLDD